MNESSMLLGLAFALLHIFTVAAILKYGKHPTPVFIHAASTLATFFILCAACITLQLSLWLATSVLAFASSSYLFCFGAIYKSLTIRMLCEIHKHKHGASIDQIDSQVTQPTFSARILLLHETGAITKQDGLYTLTAKGEKLSTSAQRIRRAFRVDTKAVYHEQNGKLNTSDAS